MPTPTTPALCEGSMRLPSAAAGRRCGGRALDRVMNFLENTLRDWKVRLEPMAARKPGQLNVTSLADASATPPTIGSSDASTAPLGASPRNSALSTTLKKGSIACGAAHAVLCEALRRTRFCAKLCAGLRINAQAKRQHCHSMLHMGVCARSCARAFKHS